MNAYIVATPLFDVRMSVEGYWLYARSGTSLFGAQDHREFEDALDSPGLDVLVQVGLEPFVGSSILFVNLNEYQLLLGMPANYSLDPKSLVVVVPGEMHMDPALVARCRTLLEKGYSLACIGPPSEETLYELVQFVLLDSKDADFKGLIRTVTKYVRRKKVVVFNLSDLEMFNALGSFTNILFSGGFYSSPITKGISEISPIKVNTVRLLSQISMEDFDLSDIAETIGRDPALSISLLRFINNSQLGRTRRIESIRQAVAILGQNEVKKWSAAAVSLQLAEDRPSEITRLALIRAKFAENLAGAFLLGMFASNLFMMGLFSLLDVILQKPMAEALRDVMPDARIKQALVDKSGEFYKVMQFINAYEHADWDEVSIIMVRHGIKLADINTAFVEALLWYRQLLDSIDAAPAAV